MNGLPKLYQNHVLANLAYLLIICLGYLAYQQLPKELYPHKIVNSTDMLITVPGANAEDVERTVILPIERMLRSKIRDIKHVNAEAQNGYAYVAIGFNEISPGVYEKRLLELRRELQTLAQTELPKGITLPDLYEGSMEQADYYNIVLYGPGNDDNFRHQAHEIKLDLQQMPGVMRVETFGYEKPEIHILFHPEKLSALQINPAALADTVSAYFQDVPAGIVKVNHLDWLIRLIGTENAIDGLNQLPVITAKGPVKLGEIADIERGAKAQDTQGRFLDQPAVIMIAFKQPGANTLNLVDSIKQYIADKNQAGNLTGVKLELLVDQSDKIRNAIHIMQNHAWTGMLLVAIVSWFFLGWKFSALTALTVPFSLSGVFLLLQLSGQSLNLSVLLGIIIVLGMLVDDAVVVIEAIDQHLNQAVSSLRAVTAAIKEVWLPVMTSSLTTIATFAPLILMKGYIGNLMGVVPEVVSLALLISILQAVWILPAQALLVIKTGVANGLPDWRRKMRSKLTRIYLKQLTKVFRHSGMALFFLAAVFVFIGLALQYDWVKVNLLPAENHTSFTVQIKMRDGVAPDDTLAALKTLDNRLRPFFQEGELRVSEYGSGISSKNGKLLLGAHFGGLWFSLNPTARSTTVLQALMLPALDAIPGVEDIWFENEANGGSPGKAIKLEIQGENGPQLYSAIAELQRIIASIPGTSQIRLENIPGAAELKLTLDGAAIQRAGISPAMVSRTLKLFAEGEVVASYTQRNEPVAVRLQAKQSQIQDIKEVLRYSVINDKGNAIPLSQLVTADYRHGPAFIYHSDYLSVRTLQAELDPAQTDVLAANRSIENQWQQIKNRFPGVKVKFSGAIETVQEGLAQLQQLFLFGLGLIFIIVGAQFQSYGLPLLVLLKIPLAFAGVILGLMLSQQAISLYTLYGGVALAGIAVNSAILMFSAAQDRLNTGMSVAHASLYAAKRRMLPILITSLTALVGLLPLASSADKLTNQWQPVASAIVWGVGFSAFFTLFAMPLLFRLTMGWSFRRALK